MQLYVQKSGAHRPDLMSLNPSGDLSLTALWRLVQRITGGSKGLMIQRVRRKPSGFWETVQDSPSDFNQ